MVNKCELPINAVTANKLKLLTGLDQKGEWPGAGVPASPVVVVAPPADRQDLTQAGIQAERGKPVCLHKR